MHSFGHERFGERKENTVNFKSNHLKTTVGLSIKWTALKVALLA
jgi:hypothetical protein